MTKKLINPNPGCWESDGSIIIADTGLFKSLIANTVIDVDCCDEKKITERQAQANAKMMAASKKMLKALKGIVHDDSASVPFVEWQKNYPQRMEAAKEAIEAAELWVDDE